MNEELIKHQDTLLTLNEASDYLRVSKVFLYLRRKEGSIQGIKAGKKVLIRKSTLEDYLNKNKEVVHAG